MLTKKKKPFAMARLCRGLIDYWWIDRSGALARYRGYTGTYTRVQDGKMERVASPCNIGIGRETGRLDCCLYASSSRSQPNWGGCLCPPSIVCAVSIWFAQKKKYSRVMAQQLDSILQQRRVFLPARMPENDAIMSDSVSSLVYRLDKRKMFRCGQTKGCLVARILYLFNSARYVRKYE